VARVANAHPLPLYAPHPAAAARPGYGSLGSTWPSMVR